MTRIFRGRLAIEMDVGPRQPEALSPEMPVLGNQLETMRAWPSALVESSNPTLQQYGYPAPWLGAVRDRIGS